MCLIVSGKTVRLSSGRLSYSDLLEGGWLHRTSLCSNSSMFDLKERHWLLKLV